MIVHHTPVLESIRSHAQKLADGPSDFDGLLHMSQSCHLVLLGECSHGTHEFYELRAAITRRLIREQGFEAVIVESDWPDAYEIDRFVRHRSEASIDVALSTFRRFPAWMWANHPVRDFVSWLRAHNDGLSDDDAVGFYGMDLFSLHRSAECLIAHFEAVDPEQTDSARALYRALDHCGDPGRYGREAAMGLRPDGRELARHLLMHLIACRGQMPRHAATVDQDRQFDAEMNAYVILHAERYYRAMFDGSTNTWNLRDAHMANTVAALRQYLRAAGKEGKVVVWAHNSHLGDARATTMGARGEWNVGQLLRERHGDDALLVGFTTYTGHVTAARDWNEPAERRWVRPARQDACEHLFNRTGLDRFFLPLRDMPESGLREPRLERAIGVVYRPESELASHYFHASVPAQFDALFHLDETSAVEPIEPGPAWVLPETANARIAHV